MPNVKQSGGGWTLPGYNFCGPFNDLSKKLDPVNALDQCCLVHDKHYGNPAISTKDADRIISECAINTNTVTGKLIAGVFAVKNKLDEATNYASDRLFRGNMPKEHNRKRTHGPEEDHDYIGSNKKGGKQGAKQRKEAAEQRQFISLEDQRDAGPSGVQEEQVDHSDSASYHDEPMDADLDARADAGGAGGGATGGTGGQGGGDPGGRTGHKPVHYRTETRTFKRTLLHYCKQANNFNSELTSTTNVENTPGHATFCIYNSKWRVIPYQVPYMSLTANGLQWIENNARAIRILGGGCTIHDFVPYSRTIPVTDGEETMSFSDRPYVMMYQDNDRWLPYTQYEINDFIATYVPNRNGANPEIYDVRWPQAIPASEDIGNLRELKLGMIIPDTTLVAWNATVGEPVNMYAEHTIGDPLIGCGWDTLRAGQKMTYTWEGDQHWYMASTSVSAIPFNNRANGKPDTFMLQGREKFNANDVLTTRIKPNYMVGNSTSSVDVNQAGTNEYGRNKNTFTSIRAPDNRPTMNWSHLMKGITEANMQTVPFLLMHPMPLLKADNTPIDINSFFMTTYWCSIEIESIYGAPQFANPLPMGTPYDHAFAFNTYPTKLYNYASTSAMR